MNTIEEFIAQATEFVGQTETEGQNRSVFIDMMNIWMPLAEIGDPYCMTGVCYTLHLLEQKLSIKLDLPRHPGAIEFYDKTRKVYKTMLFERGNLVFWKNKVKLTGHVGIVLNTPNGNGIFPTLEFNVVKGSEAGVFIVKRNINGDGELELYGIISILNALVDKKVVV